MIRLNSIGNILIGTNATDVDDVDMQVGASLLVSSQNELRTESSADCSGADEKMFGYSTSRSSTEEI